MLVIIAHLSDLHIQAATDQVLGTGRKIASAIASACPSARSFLICFSGDIAFSGKQEEFQLGAKLLEDIRAGLTEDFSAELVEFVIAPGNHDCDLITPNSLRDLVVDGLRRGTEDALDEKIIEQCASAQVEFFRFQETFHENADAEPLSKVRQFRDVRLKDDFLIRFEICNSALLSKLPEAQGQLKVLLPEVQPPLPDADLCFAMFHHPLNWLDALNARALRDHVEASADIVFSGHEHVLGGYEVRNYWDRSKIFRLEADVLAEHSTKNVGGFSCIAVNTESLTGKARRFRWNGTRFEQKSIDDADVTLANPRRQADALNLQDGIRVKLEDVGAQFTHPRLISPILEDFFVFPDLEEIDLKSQKAQLVTDPVSSRVLISQGGSEDRVLISGDEQSGKTALMRRLLLLAVRDGRKPVLLPGAEVPAKSLRRLEKHVENEIEAHYGVGSCSKYWATPVKDRVVFLDDFHRVPGNKAAKNQLLEYLKDHFGAVFVATSNLWRLEELAGASESGLAIGDFTAYQVKPLGHVLREQLIERWVLVGQEYEVSEQLLAVEVGNRKKVLDTVLGKNLLPAYPIFVLILLQQVEQQATLTKSIGSYAYLYESLLTRAMTAQAGKLDIDSSYTFLSRVANRMHEQGSSEISDELLQKELANYASEYRLPLGKLELVPLLVKAGVLLEDRGSYSFRYKYLAYYFYARYLRDHLEDEGASGALEELISTVHLESSTYTIIFLTYLSKDSSIIDAILAHADGVFGEEQEASLLEDSRFLERVKASKGILDGPQSSTRLSREQVHRNIDEYEASELASEVESVEDENEDVRSLNDCVRTIQILGQIVRNFPGSLRAERKREIVTRAYAVGLRGLKRIIDLVEEGADELLVLVADSVTDWKGLPNEDRVNRARRALAYWMELICAGMIARVAQSVGSEMLEGTFDDILEDDSRFETRLIDAAIRLESFGAFPEKKIESLIFSDEGNVQAVAILRHLVLKRFYMWPTQREIRQRYSEHLAISNDAQKHLQSKGPKKPK